jgi:hypothetical protein
MRTRADRRRADRRRKRQVRDRIQQVGLGDPEQLGARGLGRAANAWHHHACAMCGNPRRHFGEVTRQEKRAKLEDRFDWEHSQSDLIQRNRKEA